MKRFYIYLSVYVVLDSFSVVSIMRQLTKESKNIQFNCVDRIVTSQPCYELRKEEFSFMTSNQIAYHQLMETQRSNAAKEAETERANRAKEAETNRANLVNEDILVEKNRLKDAHYVRSDRNDRTRTAVATFDTLATLPSRIVANNASAGQKILSVFKTK